MAESSFYNDPEFQGFNPNELVGALADGQANNEFEDGEAVAAFDEHVGFLTDCELDSTQNVIQVRRAVLDGLRDVLIVEKIKRNPPNQAVYIEDHDILT